MTDELDEIRKKKIAEISDRIQKVEKDVEEVRAMQKEFTWADFGFDEPEWGFRASEEMEGGIDVCQRGETVAITGDERWAMLVTDLLNRAKLEELIVNSKEGEKDD